MTTEGPGDDARFGDEERKRSGSEVREREANRWKQHDDYKGGVHWSSDGAGRGLKEPWTVITSLSSPAVIRSSLLPTGETVLYNNVQIASSPLSTLPDSLNHVSFLVHTSLPYITLFLQSLKSVPSSCPCKSLCSPFMASVQMSYFCKPFSKCLSHSGS